MDFVYHLLKVDILRQGLGHLTALGVLNLDWIKLLKACQVIVEVSACDETVTDGT